MPKQHRTLVFQKELIRGSTVVAGRLYFEPLSGQMWEVHRNDDVAGYWAKVSNQKGVLRVSLEGDISSCPSHSELSHCLGIPMQTHSFKKLEEGCQASSVALLQEKNDNRGRHFKYAVIESSRLAMPQ